MKNCVSVCFFFCSVKKCKCFALFIVEVHLAIKLVHRHPTFNNLKETIQAQKKHDFKKNPTGRRQPVGYLQSVVELNPGQPVCKLFVYFFKVRFERCEHVLGLSVNLALLLYGK